LDFLRFNNNTKTVATLGPACANKETLLEMARNGMDVARLNFSHADHETHAKLLTLIREINDEYGTNIAILQDLQGPKIRIGILEEPYAIKPGDIVTLRSDIKEPGDGCLPIQYQTFAKDVSVGALVLVDDGKVQLRVLETNRANTVKLEVLEGKTIGSRKGVNLPNTKISIPTITDKDYIDIDFAVKHNVEWVALSFVRSASDVRLLKNLIRLKKGKSRVISKIEKPEAISELDEIIKVSDGIMIARGDLGVEMPLEEVPLLQKEIVRKCNIAAKPVIVATQMMESMMTSTRPTRAEVSDVANAVMDGADAIMLSGETSVGANPAKVVETINRILMLTETHEDIYYRHLELTGEERSPLNTAITLTACRLAKETEAKGIVGMTQSGFTAFQIARCRPKASIFIFSNNEFVRKQLSVVWGVKSLHYDKFVSTDETIQDVQDILKEKKLVESGDVIINTASMPLKARGLTNMVRISQI